MTRQEDVEQLADRLATLGFTKSNMEDYLNGCMGMINIPVFQRKQFGEDQMNFALNIKRDDYNGRYKPEYYEATLIKTHPIKHVHIGRLHTSEIEALIKSLNWDNVPIAGVRLDDRHQDAVDAIISLMSANAQTRDVARRLQVRYWNNTPMEQRINVAKYVHLYESKLAVTLKGDFSDLSTRDAYNLMNGRSVLKFKQDKEDSNRFIPEWKQVSNGAIGTFPEFDFMKQLEALEIPSLLSNRTGPDFTCQFICGEQIRIKLSDPDLLNVAFIEADAKNKSYLLKDEQQKSIKLSNSNKNTRGMKAARKNRGRSI